jgi:hypothetical protein
MVSPPTVHELTTEGTTPDIASGSVGQLAPRQGPDADLKLARLIKVLKDLLKEGYHPIVFCRYIPTAEYVGGHLDGALGRKAVVAAVTGTLSPAQRLDRIEQLSQATQDGDARRVLVATDCLSEGVNLQHDFNAVVHYDLAWNPTRHEQREGRVDRFGQRSEDVKVVTIYGADNGIDGKVLDVLIRKHREIRKSTGISVPVPDEDSGRVTNAIMEWLLLRDASGQQALFDLDEVVGQADKEFVYTAYDMTPLARDLGDEGAPFVWDEDRRARIRAELDAFFFRMYGINNDDADYIMETFPIVKANDIKATATETEPGTYRTKDLVLAAFDRMPPIDLAAASPVGIAYESPLDPPPGHGRRHPARSA